MSVRVRVLHVNVRISGCPWGPGCVSCGHESGPWCPAILGPQGSCQRPSAWPVVRGLGLALKAKRTHIKGSLSLGPVGQNNLMKVQEGGCGWWGVGGAARMCLGSSQALPPSMWGLQMCQGGDGPHWAPGHAALFL